ncbi:MAG TPA: hypothetical protein VMW79_01820 [Anaerolineae bacterium]|nr:hypothetical protein [Anaerolineae bacterium]
MPKILNRLLAEGNLRRHRTSAREIADLLTLVDRDLADAAVEEVSADRRFAIAYEAALQLATITLYAAGYETHGTGHHFNTFQAFREAMRARGGSTRTTSTSVGASAPLLPTTGPVRFRRQRWNRSWRRSKPSGRMFFRGCGRAIRGWQRASLIPGDNVMSSFCLCSRGWAKEVDVELVQAMG